MPLIAVDPAHYAAAATIFGSDATDALVSIYQTLQRELSAAGSMAGSDPAGSGFGSAHNQKAAAITGVTQDVINGCYKLAGLLSATGFNHARANEASVLGGPPSPQWTIDPNDYGNSSVSLAGSKAGSGHGGAANPFWWYLVVEHLDYPWPNGNPAALRSAAGAWSEAAIAITALTNVVPLATDAIAQVQSIEVAPATTASKAMGAHLRDLSAAHNAVSTACTEFAVDLDHCQSEIRHELTNLAESLITTNALGLFGALETLGIDERAAMAADEARLALAVNRISGYLTKYVTSTAVLVAHLETTVGDYLAPINQGLVWLIRKDITRSSPAGQGIYQASGALGAEYAAVRQLQSFASGPTTTVDLTAQEQAGGHTIANHVGRTDQQLIARNIDYSSTFVDSSAAERATSANIDANAVSIQEWLSGKSSQKVIEWPMDASAGRIYEQATGEFLSPSGVLTVLIRNSTGYYVLTSYPVR